MILTLKNNWTIFLGVILISLFAQLSMSFPFSPVPITGQTFILFLFASLLKPKKALVFIGIYILIGLFGAPVFSKGKSGLSALVGPTGGYLVGFILSSWFVSKIFTRADLNLVKKYFTFVLGHLIIFIPGLIGLWFYLPLSKLFARGFYPFVMGIFVKSLLVLIVFEIINSKRK